jgi:SAM-dependent methyltransferase
MTSPRTYLKDLFYKTGLVGFLDALLYRASYYRNRKRNRAFRRTHPDAIIPPDYFLYETFRLDYAQFFKDGEETARDIVDWTKGYLRKPPAALLDWGCGVSRVLMHLPPLLPSGVSVSGCDINEQMIAFGQRHYPHIAYSLTRTTPPTPYPSGRFDLVYALSIFTHIHRSLQEAWIREIHRILQTDGVFLFTTHGRSYDNKLLPGEKQVVDRQGAFTKTYRREGHRMMTTYNRADAFAEWLKPWFDVLEFRDGAGQQDLWIARKRQAL